MKKTVIALCFAAAFSGAVAQESQATPENVVFDESTGIYTITDDFVAGSANIKGSNASATNPAAAWKVDSDAAVTYQCFRTNYASQGYLQILAADDAYFTFTLPDYDCQSFSIQSFGSTNGGKFTCYAGEDEIGVIEITNENKNSSIVVNIEEKYRAAGTVYKILTQGAQTESKANNRLQMTGMTFTCTKHVVLPETIVFDEATGLYTITDNFVAGSANIIGSNANAETLGAAWKVDSEAAVSYQCYRTNYAKQGYLQILAADGAYFTFTLPDYDCQSFSIQSSGSTNGGKFTCYAGEDEIGVIEINDENRNSSVVFNIDEKHRTAGTVYKILTQGAKTESKANNRLQMTGITFTCTEHVVATWAAPVCNIENGSFLLAGQIISLSCEDGGTIEANYSYKTKDNELMQGDITDGTFTVEGNMASNANITINARVVGEGKVSSETTKWVFKFTDGQKIIIASSTFDKIEETEPYELRAFYNLEAVNFGVTKTTLTLTVTLTNKETAEEQIFTKVLSPEEDETEEGGAEEGGTEEIETEAYAENEISPVIPAELSGYVAIPNLAKGDYTATMGVAVGNGAPKEIASLDVTVNGTGIATGIEDMEADTNVAPVYYNLRGIRVEPAAGMGILIRVTGSRAEKVVF